MRESALSRDDDGEQPQRRSERRATLGESQQSLMALEGVPGYEPELDCRRGETRDRSQERCRMSSMPGESGPGAAGQHRRDDGEFMPKRVALTWLAEHGDQDRRYTSGGEQDAANTSCGMQSESGEQIAQAQTGKS